MAIIADSMIFKAFLGHNHDAAEAKKRALALATSQDRWLIWFLNSVEYLQFRAK